MSELNFGPCIAETPEYPYEFSELSEPAPVVVSKLDSHGPPDEPPVIVQGRPHVSSSLYGSSKIEPAQYTRSLPLYFWAAG